MKYLMVLLIVCGCYKVEYIGLASSLQDFAQRIEGRWTSVEHQDNCHISRSYLFYSIQSQGLIKMSMVDIYDPIDSPICLSCRADFYLTSDLKSMHLKIEKNGAVVDVIDTAYFKTEDILVLVHRDSTTQTTAQYQRH